MLCNATGKEINEVRIGTKLDENGRILKVIVFVSDENTAKIISDAIQRCIPKDGNGDEGACTGIFRLVKSVTEITPKTLTVSKSSYINDDLLLLHILYVIMIIVTYYN